MKVNLLFTTKDSDGVISESRLPAMMRREDGAAELSFVEDLSGDGVTTKTRIRIDAQGCHLTREGEISTVFRFEKGLTHNTFYKTPYGRFPAVLKTDTYEFLSEAVPEEHFRTKINYTLALAGGEDAPMEVSIVVFKE